MATQDGMEREDWEEGEETEGREGRLPTAYLPAGFVAELSKLMAANGKTAPGRQSKVVGTETVRARYFILTRSFKELRALGYKLESPWNLKEKHIAALAMSWESAGLSASTIANRISVFRVFANWINKPRLVKEAKSYVVNPSSVERTMVATHDKSWSAANVDADALIGHIAQFDWRVGLQLKLVQLFGLRKREAVMFKPLRAINLEKGTVTVRDGTKGGRERTQLIMTDRQRAICEDVLGKVKFANDSLSHPDHNLSQALRRFEYACDKFGVTKKGLGVTTHGLRHEYQNNLHLALTGEEAPVRRNGSPMVVDPVEYSIARALLSQEAGHARLTITSAYNGSTRGVKYGKPEMKARLSQLINLRSLTPAQKIEFTDIVETLAEQVLVEKAQRKAEQGGAAEPVSAVAEPKAAKESAKAPAANLNQLRLPEIG